MNTEQPEVAIVSLFRDRERMIDRYIGQIEGLKWKNWQLYISTGDNTDNSLNKLRDWESKNNRVHIIEKNFNRKLFTSEVSVDRFVTLGLAADIAFDRIAEDHTADYVVFLENDLDYSPYLINELYAYNLPAVSPMVWANNYPLKCFYDVWAFVDMNGNNFSCNRQLWYIENISQIPFEIRSSGTVVFVDAEAIYKGARFSHKNLAIKGWTEEIRELGYPLYCLPLVWVQHAYP